MKSKAQMTKFSKKENVLTLSHFGIHLAFGPALAGLTFEPFLSLKICFDIRISDLGF
jgi:hypothetical protein